VPHCLARRITLAATLILAVGAACAGGVVASADFNGDGRADVLWRNQGSGQNYLYPMNGTQVLPTEGFLRTVAQLEWSIVGVGDFDGDGKADVLWRNTRTGQNYIYFMNEKTIVAEGFLRTVPDQGWRVAGIGDLDGDGRDDIVWRHQSTGETYLYPMAGLSIKPTEGFVRTVSDLAWRIAGVADLDGDGKADILWRNSSTGQNYLYPMNGKTILSTEGFLRTVADQSWQIAAVGDLDRDLKADIVWRNARSGENYVYFMNGTTIRSEGYLRTVADLAWSIVDSGDYDGDGKTDLFWRNALTGQTYLYPMDGLAIKATEGFVRTVADLRWTVVPTPPQTDGLVAAYGFSEGSGTTTADASGNSNTGTLNGTSWTAAGRAGNALAFNGSSAFVDLGNGATLQLTGSMTISAWIRAAAFPVDDAAIVSKRTGSPNQGFQLDTTVDRGPRTIGFKLTSATGALMARYGATTLQVNQWYHVAGVYDAAAQTLDVYLNGAFDNGTLLGTVTSTQQNSALNVNIGRRAGTSGFAFNGIIDEVRIYNRALTQAQIQTDMGTPTGGGTPAPADTTPPGAPGTLTATASGSTGIDLAWGAASDNVGVAGYRVERCAGSGCTSFGQIATPTGTTFSDTSLAAATSYSYRVRAADAAGNLGAYSNAASATTAPQSAAKGPLRVLSTNPRWLADGTGNAVFLGGSHTWNNLQDWGTNASPRAFDFASYLNMLTAQGHNFTILWRTELPKFCALPTTASNPPDFTVAQHPWQRTGPGLADDGRPKFDLSKFDQSFFDRLRARAVQLNDAGIYAGVYFFTGEWLDDFRCAGDGHPLTGTNNINSIEDGGGTGSMMMSAPNAITAVQDALIDKMIDTLNDLPNILWLVSEESPASATWWNNHLIEHARAYQASKPFQHPIGFAVPGGGTDAMVIDSNADWVAIHSKVFTASNCGSGTPGCKSVMNDSDHTYFGMWNESAQANRNFAWQNFLSGNSVSFMDPYNVYYPREGRNVCSNPVNGICDAVDTRWTNFRANLGYMVRYANRMHLAQMTPQRSLASTGWALAHAAASQAEYLVYQPNSGGFTVNLSATTRVLNVEWLNPSTGAITAGSPVTGGSSAQPFTPPFSGDAVLYLVDSGGNGRP